MDISISTNIQNVCIVAVQKEGVYFREILYFTIHILMYTYVKTEKTKTCLLRKTCDISAEYL